MSFYCTHMCTYSTQHSTKYTYVKHSYAEIDTEDDRQRKCGERQKSHTPHKNKFNIARQIKCFGISFM